MQTIKLEKKLKVLDCTLRDGGYYTDWDFSDEFIKSTLSALSEVGVDIVEVGYKSITKKGFFGHLRYCNETILSYLEDYKNLEFAFMIDAKEFIDSEGAIKKKELDSLILPQKKSVFSWCRVATHFNGLESSIGLVAYFKEKGYKVTINLMGMSLLTEEQIVKGLSWVSDANPDVFYFADSFGSFHTSDIQDYIKLIKTHYKGKIGIHAHDNQGLAFANTLTAINSGIDFIDATVTGMGRGAGNTRTEQLLLTLYLRYSMTQFNPSALVNKIYSSFLPLLEKYQWGYDYAYMLSGLENIHPTYCQKLKTTQLYSIEDVATILENIDTTQRKAFNPQVLAEATNRLIQHENDEDRIKVDLQPYEPTISDSVLLVGSGPSLKKHLPGVMMFISKEKPVVIECNHTGMVDSVKNRKVAALDTRRLSELSSQDFNKELEIVTTSGNIHKFVEDLAVSQVDCSIKSGEFYIDGNKLIIPSYITGLFGFGVALLSRPKRIFLVGFDGYAPDEIDYSLQKEMEDFWVVLKKTKEVNGLELISLTPTRYPHVTQSSVYSYI